MALTLQTVATTAPQSTANGATVTPRDVQTESLPPPAASGAPSRVPTDREVQQAAADVKSAIEAIAPNKLDFSVDHDTKQSVVRVIDQKTGETIRQIPPQEMIEIAKSIDRMQGLLVKQKA